MACNILHTQCHVVKHCRNTSCFFKQRSMGFNPWVYYDENNQPTLGPESAEITKKYGPWIAPHITGSLGTNELCIWCQDFINEEWDGSSYRDLPNIKHIGYVWLPKCPPEGVNNE